MFLQVVRTFTIFRVAFSFWMDAWQIRWISRRPPGEQRDAAVARVYSKSGVRFRRAAFRLQGLIVKVGQFLSARTDVLPLAFTRELSQLQDAVPAAPFRLVRPVLESEMGAALLSVFSSFDETAMAAASLGQVHLATLKDGPSVAVKVIRPGIERLSRVDLKALHRIVLILNRFTRFGRRMNLVAIYQEFAAMVRQELDYRMEAEHLKRFQRHFADHPGIVVPNVYATYSSRRVLVMEYLDGTKITDLPQLDAWGVARIPMIDTLVTAYLRQFLQHGFVHVDPHPGNLLVLPDGRLGIIDFGMMTEIPPEEMDAIARLITGAVLRNLDAVVNAVDDLGFLQPHADRVFLKRALGYMLDRLTGTELKKGQELDDFVQEFQHFLHDEPLIVRAKYMFLGRAIGLLSGIVNTLDPGFHWSQFLKNQALPLVGTFARQREAGGPGWKQSIRKLASAIGGESAALAVDVVLTQTQDTLFSMTRLPQRMEEFLRKANGGDLTIRLDLEEMLWRLDRQERRFSLFLWFGSTALFGAVSVWSYSKGYRLWDIPLMVGTGLCLLGFVVRYVRKPRPGHRRQQGGTAPL